MNKSLYLFLAFFLIMFSGYAQDFNWAKQGGGATSDDVSAMVFDNAGNVYIAGNNIGNAVYGNIHLSEGGILVKYNPDGEVLWGKSFKLTNIFYGSLNAVTIDQADNVYIAGQFAGTLTIENVSIIARGENDGFIAKFDKDGSLSWLKGVGGTGSDAVKGIVVDPWQRVYVTGSVAGAVHFGNMQVPIGSNQSSNSSFWAQFSADGKYNYSHRIPGPGGSSGIDIKLDRQGNGYMLASYSGILDLTEFGLGITAPNSNSGMLLNKFSPDGQLQWLTMSKPTPQFDPRTSNGAGQIEVRGLALDALGNCYIQGTYHGIVTLENSAPLQSSSYDTFIAKINTASGKDIWLKRHAIRNHYPRNTLAVDSLGNIFIGGRTSDAMLEGTPLDYGNNQFILAKYNTLGRLSWVQGVVTGGDEAVVSAVALSKDGRVGLTARFGGSYSLPSLNQSANTGGAGDVLTVVMEDGTAGFIPNRLSGKVYDDSNGNCIQDGSEAGIAHMVVKAEPGSFFALTDSAGYFAMEVEKGTYAVSPVIPVIKGKNLIESCGSLEPKTVVFNRYNQKATDLNFGYQVKNCALLTVDIAADRRRRCMRSKTTVTYTNEGTADAQNVRIKVLYPRYVVPIKSTLAWASRQDSVMVFDVGTLKAGERRSFVITDSTVCGNEAIRGLSQCVKAIITPRNSCISPSSEWDQSSIVIEATLTDEDQAASFTIANEGQGDMSDSTAYRLYANEALAGQGKVKLAKGAKARLAVPNPRATLRLEADQSLHHPGISRPVASLQPPTVTPSMAAPSPIDGAYQDDADAEVSISCLNIIDSFDPNDKQASPQGISRRHYIKAEDELEYQIRFQNTGTDTAYTVVVKDTLSAFVDVASLQIGSASHPFTYTVSGKGRPVLTFTFKNINLPDHKKNEPASHGYIKFRIGQTPDNPKGTVIRNVAHNYFDYNSPIATNEVFNIIGDTIFAPLVPLVVYDCGKQLPTLAQAGPEISLCEASETVLQANAPLHGLGRWRMLSGQATLSDPTNPQARLTGIGYGEVVLEWGISLCEQVSRSQVKVSRYGIPTAPSIPIPPSQCEGSQLMPLTATGSHITWYADADKQHKLHTGNSFMPQIHATTTLYATQTVNGCESPVAAVEVNIHPATVSFAVAHDTLVGPQADSYQWYFNGQPMEGANRQKFFARNTGSYKLQTITQGCVSTSNLVAVVKNQPQATLSLGPNPASGRLHLELAAHATGEVGLVIRDRLGREIRSFRASKPYTVLEQTLELGHISAGLYLLEVRLGGQLLTRKFVQQ